MEIVVKLDITDSLYFLPNTPNIFYKLNNNEIVNQMRGGGAFTSLQKVMITELKG